MVYYLGHRGNLCREIAVGLQRLQIAGRLIGSVGLIPAFVEVAIAVIIMAYKCYVVGRCSDCDSQRRSGIKIAFHKCVRETITCDLRGDWQFT